MITVAVQQLLQSRGDSRLQLSDVAFFAQVTCQVIQLKAAVLVILDQLVVVGANRTIGNADERVVVRIVPVERLAAERRVGIL